MNQDDIEDSEDVDFTNAYDLLLYREEINRTIKEVEKGLINKLSDKVKKAQGK